MTHGSPASPEPAGDAEKAAASDQVEQPLAYGHGRMPLFMKFVWLAFLAFATWYVVEFLLTSVGREVGN